MAEGVRDIFALLHGTIRKHGQQQQTVRLGNAWVNVDPRGWKTRDDLTINVGLGSGGKAQQFAQTVAIADVQKQLIVGGKSNLVGDRELYNTAAELTRIMGHKNPDRFFNDPTAIDPQTGQLLHPPPAPPQPPPDPKLLVMRAKAQADARHQRIRRNCSNKRRRTARPIFSKRDCACENQGGPRRQAISIGKSSAEEAAHGGAMPDGTCRGAFGVAAVRDAKPEYAKIMKGTQAMSDEEHLNQAAAKAVRAQELLDNELLSEAFATLEENYTAAWRATTIEDVAAREKLFLAINIVGKIRDHLSAVVANGKLAQAELKEVARTAERRRMFGIL